MTNRFVDKKAYLDGLTASMSRTRVSSLTHAAAHGLWDPSIASRNRFGFSGPLSTDERALVVLMENGGIDLGVGSLIDQLLSAVPGASVIPRSARDALVRYVDERIRSATDSLLENAELVISRYSSASPDPYGTVQILRNGSALYGSLKDTLIQLTEAQKVIDLFVLTHGSADSIALEGSERINGHKIREIKTVFNGGRPIRLRSVYMMNCVGSSLNQAWIDIGAKVSAGSIRNNYIPEPTMYYFFTNWKQGKSFNDSVVDAYQRTISAIEAIITTGLRVAVPGSNLIPGFNALVESIADIEHRDFIQDSAPVVTGDGTVNIRADALSFSHSAPTRSFAYVPMGRGHDGVVLPRSLQTAPSTVPMHVSPQAIDFIKSFEAFRGELYNDPAGHCSIGYGHLVHRGTCDGSAAEAEFNSGITEARATDMLRAHLSTVEDVVNEAVTVNLTQNQFDALVSFAYNVGSGRRGTASQPGTGFLGSTLLSRLNAGDYSAVPTEMARWNRAGGRVLPGLTRRRVAEGRMFSSGEYATGQSTVREFAYGGLGDAVDHGALETSGSRYAVQQTPPVAAAAIGVADAIQIGLGAAAIVQSQVSASSGSFNLTYVQAQRLLTNEARQAMPGAQQPPTRYSYTLMDVGFGRAGLANAIITITWYGNPYGEISTVEMIRDLSASTEWSRSSFKCTINKLERIPAPGSDPRTWPLVFSYIGEYDPLGNGHYEFNGEFEINAFGCLKFNTHNVVSRSSMDFAIMGSPESYVTRGRNVVVPTPEIPADQLAYLRRTLP
jgi:GH24 family phage-related lysozyme (muramidase)